MTRVLVSIVDVRAGELDLNWAALVLTAGGRRRVEYPEGYEKAYAGVPMDRFPSEITAKLTEARRTHLVLIAKQRDGVEQSESERMAKLSLVAPTGDNVEVALRMIPIGEQGWDVPQKVEIPAEGVPPAGKLVVEAPAVPSGARYWKRSFTLARIGDGQRLRFRLSPSSHAGRFEASVPAGRYVLTRLSCVTDIDWLRRGVPKREIEVPAGGVKRIRVDLPRVATLTVAPRYESGAPAHEVGVYLKVRPASGGNPKWMIRIMEPSGCIEGPEVIELEEPLVGDCQVLVKKFGFKPEILRVVLGDHDVVCAPVLTPLGSR